MWNNLEYKSDPYEANIEITRYGDDGLVSARYTVRKRGWLGARVVTLGSYTSITIERLKEIIEASVEGDRNA